MARDRTGNAVEASDSQRPTASDDPLDWVRYHWQRHTDASPDAFLAMASIMRANQLMTSGIERLLKPLDLNRTSYMFLMTLLLSDSGARKLSRVSDYLLVHPTTVTLIADQLQARGLVDREAHPTDRRATLCRIKPAGTLVADQATELLAEAGFGFPGITPTAARQVVTLLKGPREMAGDLRRQRPV